MKTETSDAGAVRTISPWRSGIAGRLADVWRGRRLIPFYGIRYIRRRYARTWLGWIWIPLRPGIDIASRVLLFGGFLGVASGDRPYFIFFTFGMSAWTLFERVAFWSTRSVEMNRALMGRMYMPRLPALVACALPALLDYLLYVSVGVIGVLYYWIAKGDYYLAPPPQLALGAVGLGLLILFGYGVGMWTSSLAGNRRDIRFIVGYLLGFWFLVTPVIYPISALPSRYQVIAEVNPITGPIELVKYGMLSTAPPASISMTISLITLAVLLVSGLWAVSRFERAAISRL